MIRNRSALLGILLATSSGCIGCATVPNSGSGQAPASNPDRKFAIVRDQSRLALDQLCARNASARQLRESAEAILVFPEITKGGFIFGAHYGTGTLFLQDGRIGGYYSNIAASYGFQAGVQRFGYALFITDQNARAQLNRAGGWDIGASPSIVVMDSGSSDTFSATSLTEGAYVFFFNQRGLMAGISLEGSKITKISP